MSKPSVLRAAAGILAGICVALVIIAAVGLARTSLAKPAAQEKIIPVTGGQSKADPDGLNVLDIGSGYRLEYDAYGGKIIAPEQHFAPAQVETQKYDLGSGYTLVIQAEGSYIVSPPAAYIVYNRLDVGSGYSLVTDTSGTHLAAPYIPERRPAAYNTRIDIGSGYWLVLGDGISEITNESLE